MAAATTFLGLYWGGTETTTFAELAARMKAANVATPRYLTEMTPFADETVGFPAYTVTNMNLTDSSSSTARVVARGVSQSDATVLFRVLLLTRSNTGAWQVDQLQ